MFRMSVFALALIPSAALAAPSVEGRWTTHDGKALMEIGPCGNRICGRIARILVAVPGGLPTDVHNPDPKFRSRPLEGLVVLTGFTDAGSSWHGQIYSPEEGKSYRSTLQRIAPGELKLRGCIAIFCKSFIWKRAK